MDLGKFEVSLNVKDIVASKAFYEKLGFVATDGNLEEKWFEMHHGDVRIGIYEGHVDRNYLTWFTPDVRSLQLALKAKGILFAQEADETTSGPAEVLLDDPDGNRVFLCQLK